MKYTKVFTQTPKRASGFFVNIWCKCDKVKGIFLKSDQFTHSFHQNTVGCDLGSHLHVLGVRAVLDYDYFDIRKYPAPNS